MNRISLIQGLSLALDTLLAFPRIFSRYRLPYVHGGLGEICIIGTGPSLKSKLDLLCSTDRNIAFFSMNDFAGTESFIKIKPRYYIFMDDAYWYPESKISEIDKRRRNAVFDGIINNTTWEMDVFVPSKIFSNGALGILEQNSNVHLRPINIEPLSLVDSPVYFFMLKKNYAVSFNNVLAMAIYISINLGYDVIYLYGADHSWTKDVRVNDENQVCTITRHFNDEETKLKPWLSSDNKSMDMNTLLLYLHRHFKAYKLLRKYADMNSVKVYNCSQGSFIDAFERK